jgi:predicted MPP superfamily phosphohydrolase
MGKTRAWTKKDEKLLGEKYSSLSNLELASLLGRTNSGIEKKLSKMRLIRTPKETENNGLEPLTKKSYTEKELRDKFKFGFEHVENECPEGYTTYYSFRENGEKSVIILQDFDSKLVILPKKFKVTTQPNGQPYLWIKLNDKANRLKIIPLSDIHYGHNKCNIKKLKELISFIKNNDDIYTFLNGDLIENSNKVSIAEGVYEQTEMPKSQINSMIELLAPIAHKILWSIAGNHEDRTYKILGIDVGQFIAEKLEVPYFNEPVYVDIFWNDHNFRIFDQHGSTGSMTIGGKINRAMKPLEWNDFTNFFIMGHVHDRVNKEVRKIVRNYDTFNLDFKKQYIVICSAFLDYFGTYGAKKGYAPSSLGISTLKIFRNGDYHLGD